MYASKSLYVDPVGTPSGTLGVHVCRCLSQCRSQVVHQPCAYLGSSCIDFCEERHRFMVAHRRTSLDFFPELLQPTTAGSYRQEPQVKTWLLNFAPHYNVIKCGCTAINKLWLYNHLIGTAVHHSGSKGHKHQFGHVRCNQCVWPPCNECVWPPIGQARAILPCTHLYPLYT